MFLLPSQTTVCLAMCIIASANAQQQQQQQPQVPAAANPAFNSFTPIRLIQAQNPEQQRAIQNLVQELQKAAPQLFTNIGLPGQQQQQIALALPTGFASQGSVSPQALPQPFQSQIFPTLPNQVPVIPQGNPPFPSPAPAPTPAPAPAPAAPPAPMPAPTPVTVPTFDPMSISTPPAPSTIPEPDFAPATASGNVLSLANAPASTSASGASLGSTDLPLTFMLNGLFKNTGLGKLDTVGEHSGESLPFGLHFSPTHDSTVNDMWSKSHSGSHWETSSGTSWSKGLHTAHHSKSGQDNNKMADDYDMYDLSGLDNSAGKSATMSLVAIVLSLISLVAA